MFLFFIISFKLVTRIKSEYKNEELIETFENSLKKSKNRKKYLGERQPIKQRGFKFINNNKHIGCVGSETILL